MCIKRKKTKKNKQKKTETKHPLHQSYAKNGMNKKTNKKTKNKKTNKNQHFVCISFTFIPGIVHLFESGAEIRKAAQCANGTECLLTR